MTAPIWGIPRHGRVRSSALTLPGGGTMTYIQPSPSSAGVGDPLLESYGRTIRIAVPGVSPVERTPDELAADSAAGYRWQHIAVLSGGQAQLASKSLTGWIYCDPDGLRWCVRCTQILDSVQFSTASPLVLTFTLSRFGDFGVPAEQYSYTATLSDWGLNYPGISPSLVKLLVDDVRGDGAAAVLMVHKRYAANQGLDERRAYSFHEITITGAGSAAAIAINLVRSNAQVLTIDSSPIALTQVAAGYYSEKDDEGNVIVPWEWRVWPGGFGLPGNPPNPYPVVVGNKSYDARAGIIQNGSGYNDARRIAAMWYTEAGVLAEVVLRYREDVTVANPEPTAFFAFSREVAWFFRVEFNGMTGGQIDGTEEWFGTNSFPEALELSVFSRTSIITTDGVSLEDTVVDQPHLVGTFERGSFAIQSDQSGIYGSKTGTGMDGYWTSLYLARYANHVIGTRIRRISTLNEAYHPPLTPSGQASGAVVVRPVNDITHRYGSWCPYTHDTTWADTTPVCYV